jgi:hypothetical protein
MLWLQERRQRQRLGLDDALETQIFLQQLNSVGQKQVTLDHAPEIPGSKRVRRRVGTFGIGPNPL